MGWYLEVELGEVIRLGEVMVGFVPLQEDEETTVLAISLSCKDTEKAAQKCTLAKNHISQYLVPGPPPPKIVRNFAI